MRMLDTWHRRWLREELGRAEDEEDHVTLTEVMALDGWSGWVTAAAVDQGRLSAGVGRALHRWHVRWLMGHLDAMVASGQYGYYEEGDAIVVRRHK